MGDDAGMAVAVALVFTLVATPRAIIRLKRRQLLDHPNHRSSHDVPIPRGGGQAVAYAAAAALLVFAPRGVEPLLLAGVAGGFAFLGWRDDVSSIPPAIRLAAQFVLAIVGAVGVSRVDDQLHLAVAVVGVVAVVAYVNAFNFMDGINGISGAQAAVVGAAFVALGLHQEDALIAIGGAAAAGAALGFTPFNFPRARVFLGDVGSYFLGAWLALLAVRSLAAGVRPVAVALPFAVYLADTGITLMRRALQREPLFEAHRDHTYQRLVRSGMSHALTTSLVTAITALCAVASLVVARSGGIGGALAAAGACIAVVAYLVSPRQQVDTAGPVQA